MCRADGNIIKMNVKKVEGVGEESPTIADSNADVDVNVDVWLSDACQNSAKRKIKDYDHLDFKPDQFPVNYFSIVRIKIVC